MVAGQKRCVEVSARNVDQPGRTNTVKPMSGTHLASADGGQSAGGPHTIISSIEVRSQEESSNN